jgi:sugar lactone lactonase YvrE
MMPECELIDYLGCDVTVFDHKGKALGLIRISGVTNLGFGGDSLDKLFILNGAGVYCIELKVPKSKTHKSHT